VDDDDDGCYLIEQMLRRSERRFELTTAASGGEAIKIFIDNFRCLPHAGILMDLVLPDINGLAVLRAMRALEAGSLSCHPARFAILSGTMRTIKGLKFEKELDISLMLSKPILHDAFLKQIEAWLDAPAPELSPAREAASHFVISGC